MHGQEQENMWCPGPESNPPQILADSAGGSAGMPCKRQGVFWQNNVKSKAQ